jgi:basic membrane protein A and related proteins
MKAFYLTLTMLLVFMVVLTGCSNEETTEVSTDYTVGLSTDTGGIDDKSFNESAWKGVQAYGETNNLEEGSGYDYTTSKSDADYIPNLTSLAGAGYSLVVSVGFLSEDAVNEVAQQFPGTDFAIVDAVVDQPNVASITFAEEQGSFLAGVVAGMTTETGKVGFVGGVESALVEKFEAGFKAGVTAVDPSIQIETVYVGDFNSPDLGQQSASAMYKTGVDIIFNVAGGSGIGIFTEAKTLKQANPEQNYWVIGVDSDQWDEGVWNEAGDSVTLTSMVKHVDVAVQDVAEQGQSGNFPGGQHLVCDLSNDGVGLSENVTNLDLETIDSVEAYTQKIISGEIVVPDEIE